MPESDVFRDPSWPAGLQRRGEWYHFRRQQNGRRIVRSLDTKSLNRAIALSIKLNDGLDDKGKTIDEVVSRKARLFSEAADSYIVSRGLRPRTGVRYRAHLQNVIAVAPSITGRPRLSLAEIDQQFIAQYIVLRQQNPQSASKHKNTPKVKEAGPKTVENERNFILSVLRYAVSLGWLKAIPVVTAKVNGLRKRGEASTAARPLTEDEMPLLLGAARSYDLEQKGRHLYPTFFHDLIRTFIFTGLRHGEMQMLEWSDVDLKAGLLSVRAEFGCHRRRARSWPSSSRAGSRGIAPFRTPRSCSSAQAAHCGSSLRRRCGL